MWLNGVYLGHRTSGYVSFRWFIHNVTAPNSSVPVLNYGADNVLAVRADAGLRGGVEGWFYEGGGITRSVVMETADPLSIVPWGAFYPSVITGDITNGPNGVYGPQTASSALVLAQVDVANARASSMSFNLNIAVMDPSGTVVATSSTSSSLPSGGWVRLTPQIAISQTVQLWNTEVTNLYTVNASIVITGGVVVDSHVETIGIRDAYWTANQGFLLNGQKVPAQGFSNHQDFADCGTAIPDRVQQYRVASMRAIGSNFWRTAHNPPDPSLLYWSDRLGMMVWLENRFINQGVQPLKGPKDTPLPPTVAVADPQLLADARDMVLRDRNHPSVMIYSLCNEGGCEIGAPYGAVIAAQFKSVINAADPSRPITGNSEWGIGSTDTFTNIMDVFTCSYSYSTYSTYHQTHPWKPVMGGESASCTSDRGYYLASNATTGHVYSDDDGCVVNAWTAAAQNLWDSGNFAWTG
jgi:beta-galactosidase